MTVKRRCPECGKICYAIHACRDCQKKGKHGKLTRSYNRKRQYYRYRGDK